MVDSKVCSKCKVEKPASLFFKRADRPCGLYPSCKECVKAKPSNSRERLNARAKKWRDANPEKHLAAVLASQAKKPGAGKLRLREKRTNPEFVAIERAKDRQKYAADPSAHREKVKAWRAKNPDKVKANRQASWDSNPGARNAARQKRHAAKLQATPKWADSKQIVKIYEEAAIKSIHTGEAWHVDHVIPLQGELVCGLHVEFNLAVIPKRENLQKNNRFVI